MDVAEPQLAVRVLDLGEMTVVGLDGELVAETAPKVDAAIRDALAHESSVIVLDCSLLRAMDRHEAVVLIDVIDAYERLREVDGTLSVRQPPAAAREAIEAAGLGAHIDIEE
jgi:anti-anti-sigma factor